MTPSSLAAALAGGVALGLGLALVLLASGRVAGVSGIVSGLVPPRSGDRGWRFAFLGGLLLGGVLLARLAPGTQGFTVDRSIAELGAFGLLVGVGTRLANGCTSGHGVCGVSRLSARSLVATAVFIATGATTVYLMNHVGRGGA